MESFRTAVASRVLLGRASATPDPSEDFPFPLAFTVSPLPPPRDIVVSPTRSFTPAIAIRTEQALRRDQFVLIQCANAQYVAAVPLPSQRQERAPLHQKVRVCASCKLDSSTLQLVNSMCCAVGEFYVLCSWIIAGNSRSHQPPSGSDTVACLAPCRFGDCNVKLRGLLFGVGIWDSCLRIIGEELAWEGVHHTFHHYFGVHILCEIAFAVIRKGDR